MKKLMVLSILGVFLLLFLLLWVIKPTAKTITSSEENAILEDMEYTQAYSIKIGGTDKAAITIYHDGRIELSPNTTLDEASKVFWEFVASFLPDFIEGKCQERKEK